MTLNIAKAAPYRCRQSKAFVASFYSRAMSASCGETGFCCDAEAQNAEQPVNARDYAMITPFASPTAMRNRRARRLEGGIRTNLVIAALYFCVASLCAGAAIASPTASELDRSTKATHALTVETMNTGQVVVEPGASEVSATQSVGANEIVQVAAIGLSAASDGANMSEQPGAPASLMLFLGGLALLSLLSFRRANRSPMARRRG